MTAEPNTASADAAGTVRMRGARVALFAAAAFCYVYFFQHYERIPNPNEQTRAYLTAAIADRGTIGIDFEIRRFGDTIDVAWFNGRTLCDKAPGLSFLGVPAYWAWSRASKALGHEPRFPEILKLLRVAAVALPSLLLSLLIYWGLGMIEPDDRVRLPIMAVYLFGTTVHTYSVLLFSHAVAAGMGASAFFLAMKVKRGGAAWLAFPSGLFAGYAVLTEYPLLIAAAITSVYVLLSSWKRPGVLALFAIGALGPAALMMLYNKAAFCGYFSVGYAHIGNQYFAQFHRDGALGVTTPKAEAFFGSFFSSSRGYFPFQPWLLLAFPGLYAMWTMGRRNKIGDPGQPPESEGQPRGVAPTSENAFTFRVEAVAVTAAVLGFGYFISSFSYWQAGGTVSQRHLTALTPWLAMPITALVASELRSGGRICGFLLAAAGLFSIFVITACTVPFPFFSTQYPNPLFELALRLWRYGMIPYSIGRNAGLQGISAALPYLLVIACCAAFFLGTALHGSGGGGSKNARFLVPAAAALAAISLGLYSLSGRDNNLEGKRNDLWGIVVNYEPREGFCDAAPGREDAVDPVCRAFTGNSADALEVFRRGDGAR